MSTNPNPLAAYEVGSALTPPEKAFLRHACGTGEGAEATRLLTQLGCLSGIAPKPEAGGFDKAFQILAEAVDCCGVRGQKVLARGAAALALRVTLAVRGYDHSATLEQTAALAFRLPPKQALPLHEYVLQQRSMNLPPSHDKVVESLLATAVCLSRVGRERDALALRVAAVEATGDRSYSDGHCREALAAMQASLSKLDADRKNQADVKTPISYQPGPMPCALPLSDCVSMPEALPSIEWSNVTLWDVLTSAL